MVSAFVLGALICFGGSRREGKTILLEATMWSPRFVRKRSRRCDGAAVSFWPVVRWQAESLKVMSGENVS